MRPLILLLALLTAPIPSRAQASGVDIAWDDCWPAGTVLREFACDRNTGVDVLSVSFAPPVSMSRLGALEASLDLYFRAGYVPSWWRVSGAGACRASGLSVLTAPPTQPATCADDWIRRVGAIAVTVEPDFGGYAGRARVTILLGVADAEGVEIEAGVPYYAFFLALRRNQTVGPDACSGCDQPAYIPYPWITLTSMGDSPVTIPIQNPLNTTSVCWQCECGVSSHGGIWYGFCSAVATARRTWGGIKGLYR